MAFDGLADRLQDVFSKITGKGKISEADLKDVLKEVRLALLEADVNYKVVKSFVAHIKDRALGSEVMESLTPGQQVVKIVHDELTQLMGGEQEKIQIASQPPTVIMMVGLQGSGKTTTSGKLARYMRDKMKKRPLLVACDVYRPVTSWIFLFIRKERMKARLILPCGPGSMRGHTTTTWLSWIRQAACTLMPL